MFTKSAAFYDAIYSFKDYEAEAQKLHIIIEQHRRSDGTTLLDVACGTGAHLPYLMQWYAVEGLDLDEQMLAVTRERLPDVPLHQGDMADFDLGRQFDVITCLFSSIGYVKTVPRLRQTLANFNRHLLPGGVVAVEPWFPPERWEAGHVHAIFVDKPDLKIARTHVSQSPQNGVAVMDFHYLVATPQGSEYFTERHELTLFTHEEYLDAFRAASLEVNHDPEGLTGRGLYVGVKSQ